MSLRIVLRVFFFICLLSVSLIGTQVQAQSPIELKAPFSVKTTSQIQVQSPIELKAPFGVKTTSPIQVQSPIELKAPFGVKTTSPIQVQSPIELKAPFSVKTTSPIQVQSPIELKAPFGVKTTSLSTFTYMYDLVQAPWSPIWNSPSPNTLSGSATYSYHLFVPSS